MSSEMPPGYLPVMATLIYACLAAVPGVDVQADAVLAVGQFSAELPSPALPAGWRPLIFKGIKNTTRYSLVREEETTVVKAIANRSASGLTREITIDPKEYPWVQWRWKVTNLLQKGDVRSKQGDDYPARLYITFAYDPTRLSVFQKLKYEAVKLLYGDYPPLAAINYIWDGRTPEGKMVSNAYTDRVMMIVVESGPARLNQWVAETRNLYEDYRQAFGEEPPPISGVAIMTDTDNTGESATAYYGDIVFKKARD
jgi:hypothetical protein